MCVIRKNCMEEIAAAFGVKLGEDFTVDGAKGYNMGVFNIDKCGLWKYDKQNKCYYECNCYISHIVLGRWGVRKMTNEEIVKEALNCTEK